MAQEVILRIKVQDAELEQLENELKGLNATFKTVESGADKAESSIERMGKNGGLIATLDRLTEGWASQIRDAGEALGAVNIKLKATRAAMIATGVGAVAVALGLLVTYWEDILAFITQVNEELEEQIAMQQARNSLLDAEFKILEEQEKLLIAQGKSTEFILEKKRELLQIQIGAAGAELALLQLQQQRIENQAKELNFYEKAANFAARILTGGVASNVTGASVTAEEQAEISAGQLAIRQLEARIISLQTALQTVGGEPQAVRGADQSELPLPTLGVTLSQAEELGEIELDFLTVQQRARRRLEEQESAERTRIATAEADAKIQTYELTANAFAAASSLIGRETAAGKAFAVSAALISTWLSAQKAYESQFTPIAVIDSPVRAALAAAAAVAAGLANVKQILSTNFPGGSGGSIPGGSPSIPPAFNIVQSNPQNQLNAALLEQNNEPVEAFVVEGGITSKQELKRKKVSSSSFG